VKQKEQVSFGPLLQRCVHAQSLLVPGSTSWQMHFGIPVDKIIWLSNIVSVKEGEMSSK
jgi:hypothetical protein